MPIFRRLTVVAGAAVALATLVLPVRPAAAGGGCHVETPTEGTGTTVELSKACMNPIVLRVDTGATVTFVNRDPALHNLYALGWAHGDLAPGESTSHWFPNAGIYPYACTLHAGMVGAIVVGDGHVGVPIASVAARPAAAVRSDRGTSAAVIVVIALVVVAACAGGLLVRRLTR